MLVTRKMEIDVPWAHELLKKEGLSKISRATGMPISTINSIFTRQRCTAEQLDLLRRAAIEAGIKVD